MIGDIGKRLRDAFRSFVSKTAISEKEIDLLIKELQRVLISSDVDVRTVADMSRTIRNRVLHGGKPLPGMTLKEHVLRVVYDELVEVLGKGTEASNISLEKPVKVVLAGVFGSGKTTTAAKLGNWFKRKGVAMDMVCLDRDRPAAFDQLKQAVAPLGLSVTRELTEGSMIVDTAGRDVLDETMMNTLRRVIEKVRPSEVLLVVPAEMGHVAGSQAEAMKELLTGVIITRMDGSAKGGGALSACAKAGVPVKFVGSGERLQDLEVFEPKSFVSRLLGWGDLKGLMEQVQDAELQLSMDDLSDLNMLTFYKQLEGLSKLGPVEKVLQMMGLTDLDPKTVGDLKTKLKKYKVIIDSMTARERQHPDILSQSRIERIARGSGCEAREVKALIKEFMTMKQMMGKLKKGKLPKGMRGMDMKKLKAMNMSGMMGGRR
ncbi:MAG TPA: signal recognition particle protein Srp19 [archaeon]|nr:signal recognition particle protein Srp19 [archaeon]